MLAADAAFHKMNDYGGKGIPFLFVVDFECRHPLVIPLNAAEENGILYNIRGKSNCIHYPPAGTGTLKFEKFPVSFETYRRAFDVVKAGIAFGNSYLLNLTFATPIQMNLSLKEIFFRGQAPYRLLFKDEFTVFSPESFIRTSGSTISSYPMKGTIDAGLAEAAKRLLSDPKEMAEHNTIVDLIRNDLSTVASRVRVSRFRYLEEIKTNQRHLLQASSEITGQLPLHWQKHAGDLLKNLLPAGSVSGAPKKKTLELIRKAEPSQRGYYTGVFGIFDGMELDSAVMIRFIEKRGENIYFRSGGGITINSNAGSEYREMIDKVYVTIV